MPLVTQSIKNLKGGISQQPDILRFPDQGKTQINGFSSEVQGLQKRAPSVHVARLRDSFGGSFKPLVKLINRDDQERYYVVYHQGPTGGIQVFDLEGNEKTVNAPQGFTYVGTMDPRTDLRTVTVADYTFIVNRKKTVMESSTLTHPGFREKGQALIAIKGGQYGRTYKVFINGVQHAVYQTPDGNLPEHVKNIDTQFITQQLLASFQSTLPAGWNAAAGPNWIKLTAPGNDAVNTLVCEDGFGGSNLVGVIFEAQRFNMLPAVGPNGYLAKVAGDPGSGSDDYYVRYDAGTGVWRETVAPGVAIGMNNTTMPHVLVREANGTFTFRPADWDLRSAGDDDSNPLPSFVDQGISDVFFFRNRLGIIAGENIVLSRSGDFFSFFPKSVVAIADTDPVDVAVSHNRVSILNHAVPFAEELLLWSDQTQFVLRSDGVLSPRSVRVDQSTEFESAIAARPVPAGRSVYFAAPRASFTSIRRYYSVQDVSSVKNADDISSHVPSYIPNGVFYLGGSTTENVVTILTEGAVNKIFLYKYLYMDEQIVQQSWSHWEFAEGSRILACEFIGPVMWIMRDTDSGVFLEYIEFTQNTKDFPGEPYRVHADRKVRSDTGMTWVPNENLSFISLNALYGTTMKPTGEFWIVLDNGKTLRTVPSLRGATWVLAVPGNQSGQGCTVGAVYTFFYEFSKFLIKVQDSQGTRSEDVGRLQVRRAWVNYEDSGPFTVEVCGRWTYVMTGKRLGQTVLGSASTDTGQFKYPVMADSRKCSVTITSDSPTPVSLIGAGWNGVYWRREEAF